MEATAEAVLFAIARTVGRVAQWQEMISDSGMRIGRPRQLYIGPVSSFETNKCEQPSVALRAYTSCATGEATAVAGVLLAVGCAISV
jgi:hypothetical protein